MDGYESRGERRADINPCGIKEVGRVDRVRVCKPLSSVGCVTGCCIGQHDAHHLLRMASSLVRDPTAFLCMSETNCRTALIWRLLANLGWLITKGAGWQL